MKKKIVIVICTLLILTTISVTGLTIEEKSINLTENLKIESASPIDVDLSLLWWLIGADQKQLTHCGYGFAVDTNTYFAQSFKPTKNKITAAAVGLFKVRDPPPGLTLKISIRDDLWEADLTSKIINADRIRNDQKLYLADFDDITVTPEKTYYLVIEGGDNVTSDWYNWLFDVDEKYDRGHPWLGRFGGISWEPFINYEDKHNMDFLFITYFIKPFNSPMHTHNTWFFWFLQNHPRMFPILRHLLGLV